MEGNAGFTDLLPPTETDIVFATSSLIVAATVRIQTTVLANPTPTATVTPQFSSSLSDPTTRIPEPTTILASTTLSAQSISSTPSFITVTIETGIPGPTPTVQASGLTPGQQAAIAVPTILAAIALLALGILLFRRRQRRRKGQEGEGGGGVGARRMADTEPYYGQEKHALEDDEARRQQEDGLAGDKTDKSGREMRASIAMADDT